MVQFSTACIHRLLPFYQITISRIDKDNAHVFMPPILYFYTNSLQE